MDENDSDVDVGDEEDDLLADGEGIPEDEVDEVDWARMNELATCKCVKLFA